MRKRAGKTLLLNQWPLEYHLSASKVHVHQFVQDQDLEAKQSDAEAERESQSASCARNSQCTVKVQYISLCVRASGMCVRQ